MRELVSELTPRAGPALSLSRETPRAVRCVVCGRREGGVSRELSLRCLAHLLDRDGKGGDGGWWCDDCVAVGFRGRWWRVCGATLLSRSSTAGGGRGEVWIGI